MIKLVTTFFGAGLLKPAPGTWGSLAALPAFYLLHITGGAPLAIAATIIVFFLGWWATARHTEGSADHDPAEIVIDEVAGMWLALIPVSIGADHVGANVLALYPGWIVAFLGFRFFDILKPWPVSWADRKSTPLGVMLDDVIAGLMAAVVVVVLATLAHTFLI